MLEGGGGQITSERFVRSATVDSKGRALEWKDES